MPEIYCSNCGRAGYSYVGHLHFDPTKKFKDQVLTHSVDGPLPCCDASDTTIQRLLEWTPMQ